MEYVNNSNGFEQLPLSDQLKHVGDALLAFSPAKSQVEQLRDQLEILLRNLEKPF